MTATDKLIDGAPVPDGECWFRFITNTDHFVGDELSLQAFKKQFKTTQLSGFTYELSGQLYSKHGSIKSVEAAGRALADKIRKNYADRGRDVPRKLRFWGVACATANELKGLSTESLNCNVLYTPMHGPAHADFVTSASCAQLNDVMGSLKHSLSVVLEGNLAKIASCGA